MNCGVPNRSFFKNSSSAREKDGYVRDRVWISTAAFKNVKISD